MNSQPSFINRELSWLSFNRRVLGEALHAGLPQMERLKFLAITASNLDEFFMVRVGGLQQLVQDGYSKPDPSGLTPAAQLAEIDRITRQMVTDQYYCFLEDVEPKLAAAGIQRIRPAGADAAQRAFVRRYFDYEVLPIVTPQAIHDDADFPFLPGLRLNLVVRFKRDRKEKDRHEYAVLSIPRILARYVVLPSTGGYRYMLIEDVISSQIGQLFEGEPVAECSVFRLTRNADMGIREDMAEDLLNEMKELLVERKHSDCVRLEVGHTISGPTLTMLKRRLDVDDGQVYSVNGPLDLSAYFRMAGMPGFDSLKLEAWPPQWPSALDPAVPLFDTIAKKDVLLFHPYESFDPVVRFIEAAAEDPDVLAIKQILYRTSDSSPVVAALARAAERDKHVTALVELKARFDEARNIEWAQALERAGVQVIYGLRGLKTHAKICIVVRREPAGIRRYVHFATGNYNEKTSRIYSDVGLMTCHEDFAVDASAFFNAITGYSQPQRFRKIDAAPVGLRARILSMINNETERQKQKQKSLIMAKMNSLEDPEIIQALYRASQAGVKVLLNVRGICCLRPGVPGQSENITVISVVDRFLEHARILYFYNGGTPGVFISSADWMPRNLDRRVELLVPVEDEACRNRLVGILETFFADTTKASQLMPDGSYRKVESAPRKKPVRAQELLYRQICEASRQAEQDRATEFEPRRATET